MITLKYYVFEISINRQVKKRFCWTMFISRISISRCVKYEWRIFGINFLRITELSRSKTWVLISSERYYEKFFMFFWNIGVAWNVTRSKNLDEMLNKMLKYKIDFLTHLNSFKLFKYILWKIISHWFVHYHFYLFI